MTQPKRYDAIVIGGGLVGASAAFHLRHVHGMSVLLLERGLVGAQASGVNFGHVRRQGRFLGQMPLAHRSRAIWGELNALVGEDCEFLPSGSLKLAFSEKDMETMAAYAREARHWGLDLVLLGRDEVLRRWPWIMPAVCGASLGPHDGHANPRLAAPAFGRAARRLGADVREQCEVSVVMHDGHQFRVQCADGASFAAPLLLNSAGAWGNRVAGWFGESAPMIVKGPQMAVTEPIPYFIGPVIGSAGGVAYFRQVKRGNIVFGGGRWSAPQLDPPRAYTVPGHAAVQWADVCRLIPSLRHTQLIRTWSGVEGYVQDNRPVLGPSPGTPGLFHAFGFCGEGFQLAPGVGAVAAEYLATGNTATPIEPFSLQRFANAEASHSTAATASAA